MDKKKEQDVLIVRDEKTGELGVVSGLDKNGTPKRIPAESHNASDFLKFDRHGDMLDNFFMNFFRQCQTPSHFGFYRLAADQAEQLLDVMKELLKDPAANKEVLSPHKVDTSGYERKVQEEQVAGHPEGKQEESPHEETEQKRDTLQQPVRDRQGYRPINEGEINWQELEEKWGVRRDDLEKSGDLSKMLNYGKSDLVKVTPTFGGETFHLDARLSFRRDADGNVRLTPHFIRREQKLSEYKGYIFSAEDKQNLRDTGNLGRIVDLVDKATGERVPSIISIDRKTHELTDMAASKLRIPIKIGKTEITPSEQEMLRAGLPVRDKTIEGTDGRKFVTTLQVNVERRGVEFVPGTGKSSRPAQGYRNRPKEIPDATAEKNALPRNSWTDADGNIRPISKWKDILFTENQKADYIAGKTVKLENATDKEGNPCTLYLKFNPNKGRPFASKENPEQSQDIAPSDADHTRLGTKNESMFKQQGQRDRREHPEHSKFPGMKM